jgi:hypothetical protein
VATRFVLDPDWQRKVTGLGEPALENAALIVEAGQKRRIPVSRDGSHGRPSGYARDHVHIERGRDLGGPWRDVGSDAKTPDGTDYPLILELGSSPHVIESHGDYPLRNRRTGQVFGRRVMHPGTHPHPWCRAALEDLAGRRL